MQLAREHSGATEEHTDIRLGMLVDDRAEHAVPVGATEVRGGPEARDRILLRADVLHDDVVHVLLADLRRQVDVDLDAVLRVLLLDRVQERVEPLGGAEVADDPREVHLGEARRLRRVEVVHPVPDRLEDRRERGDTNTRTDEQHRLVVEEVLRRGAERPVDHDAGQHAVNGRVRCGADDLAAGLALLLPVEVAADGLGEVPGEVADDADVDGDVVLLRGATFVFRSARSSTFLR